MVNSGEQSFLPKTRANLPLSGASGLKLCSLFLLCLCAYSSLFIAQGQDRNEDMVRVRTRVVSIDTLVWDKKTGALVTDLTRDDFEVLADGKPRKLSYFSRGGEDHRRPLAL